MVKSPVNSSSTWSDLIFLAALIARHSRLNSSITVIIFTGLPSCVLDQTKS